MQILEIDWQRFLDDLPRFQPLPLATRRLFLEKVRPSQPVSSLELGESFEVLCASGFMLPGVRGVNATVPPKHRAFCRVMRALYRHRVFDSTSRDKFYAYLADHFTTSERGSLYGIGGNYYYGEQTLYTRVTSVEWLERFLAASADRNTNQHADRWGKQWSFPPEVLQATRDLVRRLMGRASPVALTELRNLWPEGNPALLSPALVAGISLSASISSRCTATNWNPCWASGPAFHKRLHRPPPKPPGTVTPHQVFESPFLMDNMASILAICAAEPFRIRSNDYGLFERSYQAIASALGTLPEWVENQFGFIPRDCIDWALTFLKYYEFLKQKGHRGEDLRLEVTEAGRNWLGLAGERPAEDTSGWPAGQAQKANGVVRVRRPHDFPAALLVRIRFHKARPSGSVCRDGRLRQSERLTPL